MFDFEKEIKPPKKPSKPLLTFPIIAHVDIPEVLADFMPGNTFHRMGGL